MPGFLTRLVERARGTGPAARPLIAPSYSPAPELRGDRSPLVAADDHVEAEGARTPAGRGATRRLTAPAPESQPPDESASLSSRDEDAAPRATAQTLMPPRPIAPPAEHASGERADKEIASPTDHASAAGRESRTATNVKVTEIELLMPRTDRPTSPPPIFQPQPRATAARDAQEPAADAAISSPSRPGPASAEQVSGERAKTSEASARQSEHVAEPAASAKSPAPRVIQVSTVRREVISTPGESAAAREHVVESPPTVHVSIGRVEVRAVAPPRPAPPRAQAPAAPKMSLDEYLRSQDGRRG